MLAAIIVSMVIIIYNLRLPAGHLFLRVALGMQLGGALGNLIDRARLGHVTDFIDVGPVPIFNIADAAVVRDIVRPLRQVALIVLLAHIGSFVPAESANIGLVDRIFTRLGAHDELHAGRSTFRVERVEAA